MILKSVFTVLMLFVFAFSSHAEEALRPAPEPEQMTFKSATALAIPDKPSIAVLPFANLSGDVEQDYFSDGITNDLITDLSKLSGLFVVSRNAVFLYKGKHVKPEQAHPKEGWRISPSVDIQADSSPDHVPDATTVRTN